VGTDQFPVDAALASQLFARDAGDFAADDCWSLGGSGVLSHVSDGTARLDLTPAERRKVLQDAFREGDVFLSVSVPPRWEGSEFASARPGVHWRQQSVTANGSGGEPGGRVSSSSDLWGRTLPAQSLGDARASEANARFVPQLATDALIEKGSSVSSATATLPRGFTVGPGTVIADDSAKGDVDIVMGNKVAVCATQTWPHAHAFSLLDAVAAESLRQDPITGLPLWLCE
jgi:hypothetical protein